jgi:hypothetical protein
MGITVKINAKKSYELLTENIHPAVLADIVDLGQVATKFGLKPKVRLVWITSELDKEQKSKRAFETYTLSLHEKAGLRKRLNQLGVVIPATGEFEMDQLIGLNTRLVIQHNVATDGSGEIYANVASVMKPVAGSAPMKVPADFVRAQDKEKKAA